jgi:hypothetical protein
MNDTDYDTDLPVFYADEDKEEIHWRDWVFAFFAVIGVLCCAAFMGGVGVALFRSLG